MVPVELNTILLLLHTHRHSEDSDELIKEILKFKSFITDTNKRRTLALAGHSPYTDISQLVTKSGASKRPAWTTAVNSAFQQLLKDIKRVLTENCIIPITELDFYEEYDFFEELGELFVCVLFTHIYTSLASYR